MNHTGGFRFDVVFFMILLVVISKSLFEDNSTEIQELTLVIKEKLGELNREILKLQEISKNPKLLHGSEDLHAHAHQVILVLQSKLAQISSSFKDTLTSRTQVCLMYIWGFEWLINHDEKEEIN